MVASDSLIDTARALAQSLATRSGEIEAARRLPADIARSFAEARFFRLVVPQSIGGLEAAPDVTMRVIETVSQADASAGWCVMIGATSALSAAYLEPAAARTVYGDPMVITGGSNTPTGKAEAHADGYRVSGRWPWVSGGANCHWLKGISLVHEDGRPRMLANGMPDARMMIFPARDVRLIDTWHAAGLRGTGSGDMEVDNLPVPRAFSYSLVSDKPVEAGPLYAFPAFGLLGLGIGAVALGNARGAIDDLKVLAGGKRPQGSRRTLAERSGAQSVLAQAEAQLGAANSYFYDTIGAAWSKARRGDPFDVTDRARLRLAATHAARASADVARAMYDLGGGSAVFEASPLQRRFRDAHVATQHMMVAPQTYELTGRVLMGLETDASML
jgi:alkylation response protein AidB-like acyl-CoA dehydrogenase